MVKEKTKRQYIDVNVPRDWGKYLEEALENPEIRIRLEGEGFRLKPSSLGVWIIKQWLIDNTDYRFQYINASGKSTIIYDRKLRRKAEIFLREKEKDMWCDLCESNDCVHIRFVLRKVNDVRRVAEKLASEGWNIPEV